MRIAEFDQILLRHDVLQPARCGRRLVGRQERQIDQQRMRHALTDAGLIGHQRDPVGLSFAVAAEQQQIAFSVLKRHRGGSQRLQRSAGECTDRDIGACIKLYLICLTIQAPGEQAFANPDINPGLFDGTHDCVRRDHHFSGLRR